MTFRTLKDAEDAGETLGLLALNFKRYTFQQKCFTISCICFICVSSYYFVYHSLNRTPTNLRLDL